MEYKAYSAGWIVMTLIQCHSDFEEHNQVLGRVNNNSKLIPEALVVPNETLKQNLKGGGGKKRNGGGWTGGGRSTGEGSWLQSPVPGAQPEWRWFAKTGLQNSTPELRHDTRQGGATTWLGGGQGCSCWVEVKDVPAGGWVMIMSMY